ncbi:hypothetical protein B0H14DRAFT_2607109 [Mycena olivaceomarginata]|nr:hypothetical protein B0H14DRAFT_2607109 [Mycena olivaceomarginata]
MPFPALARVATTKTEETAVPKLNQYQRSWIFDVALHDADLPGLSKQARAEFYEKVKNDTFEAKAFQHKAQPGDSEEEVCVPKLMAAWKRENQKATTTRMADDGDGSDHEEDKGARVGLLHGYTKAGWLRAIQKVITNKQTAAKTRKPTKTDNTDSVAVLHRTRQIPRERHNEINAHFRTLLGPGNAGGKFRKAEVELWANKDQAKWESAAEADEDVDWEERQKLPMGAVQHMVDTLNAGRKFRPFLATMLMGWVNERGEIQFECINAMYEWAKKGLQDYAAARDGSPGQPAPVFPVSVEALDDMSPNMVAQTVTDFLIKSYSEPFRSSPRKPNPNIPCLQKLRLGDETQNIPWPTIATAPDQYYDVGKFDLVFSSSGLEGFKGTQWHLLGAALAVGAGDGSSGFFRKGSVLAGGEEDTRLQRKDDEEVEDACKAAEAEEARKEDEAEAARKAADAEDAPNAADAEDARRAADAEDAPNAADAEDVCRAADAEDTPNAADAEDARRAADPEEARKEDEAEAARKEDEVEAARKAADAEDAPNAVDAEDVRRAVDPEQGRKEDEAEAARKEADAEGVRKTKVKKSRKRKASEDGLEADEEGAARRTARARKTPAEAEAERKEKLAAATSEKRKPGYSYVEKSPVKKGRGGKSSGGNSSSPGQD